MQEGEAFSHLMYASRLLQLALPFQLALLPLLPLILSSLLFSSLSPLFFAVTDILQGVGGFMKSELEAMRSVFAQHPNQDGKPPGGERVGRETKGRKRRERERKRERER